MSEYSGKEPGGFDQSRGRKKAACIVQVIDFGHCYLQAPSPASSSPPGGRRGWGRRTSCSPTSAARRWCGAWWRRRWQAGRGRSWSSRGIRPRGSRRRWAVAKWRLSTIPIMPLGFSSSLKAGIGAVPAGCDGALVLLGDMPQITGVHLDRLIAAFAAEPGAAIVVPTREGRRGNPDAVAARPLRGDAATRGRRRRQAFDGRARAPTCARSISALTRFSPMSIRRRRWLNSGSAVSRTCHPGQGANALSRDPGPQRPSLSTALVRIFREREIPE